MTGSGLLFNLRTKIYHRKFVMAKMVKKSDLPSKTCLHCGLPFAWRKKWARAWDEIKYCSERCKSEGKRAQKSAAN